MEAFIDILKIDKWYKTMSCENSQLILYRMKSYADYIAKKVNLGYYVKNCGRLLHSIKRIFKKKGRKQ